jgi:hypothetical protein
MGDDGPVFEDIRIEGSVGAECPAGFEGECRRMTVVNGRESIEIDVRVTASALIPLGGRDVDDWLEERVLAAASSLPNDGRKLRNLAANAPLEFGADHVTD